MKRRIKIGIAEDHELVRQGLESLFREDNQITVMFSVSNGNELLETLKKKKPDVILLDIEMPVINGREALSIIAHKYPELKVLVVSMHSAFDFINECISLGASGFLSKDSDFEKVLDAIYSVVSKGYYFDDIVSKAILTDFQMKSPIRKKKNSLDLTDIQIIRLICEGKKTKEIAELLCLSERTIEGRRLRISKKTETNNVVELVVYAIKNKIFDIY